MEPENWTPKKEEISYEKNHPFLGEPMLVFGGVGNFHPVICQFTSAKSLRILRGFCCACPLCMAEGGPMLPAELVPPPKDPKVDGRHTGHQPGWCIIPAAGRLVVGGFVLG